MVVLILRPLWGIGLIEQVNGHTNFLRDGPARNIQEAILWHGGETENAKQVYSNIQNEEREALLKFLTLSGVAYMPKGI